jgi:hypothetical protein
MAKYGQEREAAAIISPLIQREATLAGFIEGLATAGIIESSAATYLLRAAKVRAP